MSFDALAPWYRTLEWIAFGNTLQRCRVACLDQIVAVPKSALIVGEGNGRFLCELLLRYPKVEVDCIDASDRMLKLARKRVESVLGHKAEKVRWLCQDIRSWTAPAQPYDLLVTHFVLDCFPEEELAAVVGKLAHAGTAEVNWLLADFCVPDSGVARVRARVWLAVMYRFFRLTAGISADRLVDPAPFLRVAGFGLCRQHLFRSGLLTSEIWRKL